MMIFYSIILLLIPISMIIIGLSWRAHYPKKINFTYGYRTSRSTQSQQAWDFAHKHFAKTCTIIGIALTIITIIALVCLCIIQSGATPLDNDSLGYMVIIVTVVQLAALIISIVPTETALKRNFKNPSTK